MGIIELLRTERAFRRLWLSQVVSDLGDWFQLVAIFSMFPTTRGGSSLLSALLVGRHVVAGLATPIAGVVADRFDRGRVMIAADLARAVVMMGFLAVRGPEDVVLVFVLSLLLEGIAIFFEPARGAAIPQIVPAKALYAANALGGATWSAMLAFGSLIGGVIAALVGRRAAFVANAVSFLASAFFVARARIPPLPRAEKAGEPLPHPLRDLRDGLGWLRTHGAQRALLVLKAGALLSGGFFVLVTVFADRVFAGQQALTMGILFGCRGVGAFVMPFALVRVFGQSVRGLGRTVLFAFPVAVIGFFAFAGAPSIPLAGLGLLVGYGATSTVWVVSAQLLQLTVPNEVLGRVLSVELLLVTASIATSGTLVAYLLDGATLAPRIAAACMGAVLLLPFSAWAIAWRRHEAALRAAAEA